MIVVPPSSTTYDWLAELKLVPAFIVSWVTAWSTVYASRKPVACPASLMFHPSVGAINTVSVAAGFWYVASRPVVSIAVW